MFDKLITEQSKLFNEKLDSHQIEYIFKNNIMIYHDISNIDIEASETFSLEEITWDYDENNDPITEVLKKYAMEAIRVATRYSFNVHGVISDFKLKEGFANVDGSLGLTLISVDGYEFDDEPQLIKTACTILNISYNGEVK
jgi:hypothetical protein